MHEITKDIDTRLKIFKYLYLQDILILGGGFGFFHITKNIVPKGFSNLYVVLGIGFIFYLILNSPDNKNKRIFNSVIYALAREKETIKSIDRKNLIKEHNDEKLKSEIFENLSRKEKKKYKKEQKKKKIEKTTLDLIDILYFDNRDYLKHKKGYIEILEIIPQDLMNLNYENTLNLIQKNSYFYMSYQQDIKIISMNFPVNFEEQIQYFNTLLENENNEFKSKFLRLKVNELEKLQETRYNKEFFMFLFSQNEVSIEEDVNQVLRILPGLTKKISREKKEKILFKLNNMNTKI